MPPQRERTRQLAYSEQQALMLDERSRRTKARKIAAVVSHFLGRQDLSGLRVLDVGCSGGLVADELRLHGARVVGADIDVPGLARAVERFGAEVAFACADSEQLPFADGAFDVVVCNHVYEHVVDPQRVFDEIRRVLADDGIAYLGLGNRLGVMEPHYRLPFLSWLPGPLADRYVRAFGRAEHYHERFTTWPGLRRLAHGFDVWDYTYAVLADPVTFGAGDVVPGWVTKVPTGVLRATRPLVPTYLWIGSKRPRQPAGKGLTVPPEHVAT